jgi:RNA polymerase sigma-70 factor (ECF subfamily)
MEGVQEVVRQLWEHGRAAWPALAVELAVFQRHVLGGAGGDATPDLVERLNGEDLYLACACLAQVPGAIGAFEKRHGEAIARHLRRMNLPAESIQELRQALMVKLFVGTERDATPAIAGYSGRGALVIWLRMTVARMALNLLRDQKRVVDVWDSFVEGAADPHDAELSFIRQRYEPEFRAALRDGLTKLPRAERMLLRMHYGQGLTSEQLAAVTRTTRPTAHRRLVAARERLWELVRGELQARLELSASELQSLLRVVRSNLVVSLVSELREGLKSEPGVDDDAPADPPRRRR